ncbi:MAG: SAM-dependent methyltransferase [Spirochaetales bacterium]|nr:SAM-dependent methyltransferase [Spirochaetales bacterium]
MNTGIRMEPIGSIDHTQKGTVIRLNKTLAPGLTGIGGFSHLIVLWHFDKAPWDGTTLTYRSPYVSFTGDLGIFATRGPFRPNGIAMDICRVLGLDEKAGEVTVDWIDAEQASPVLDIKPFHPSSDVVTAPQVPAWCAHWPKTRETSGEFDWGSEFAFG